MKVLVLNGSPKGERSDTMKVTRAFLEGIQATDYEVIDTMKKRVNPCLGCFSCWWGAEPGKCVQKDGMEEVLTKIKKSDLVIWSFPLYCYGMPSNIKAYVDRLLPLSTPEQRTDENGHTYHPCREEHQVKMIMISGCGFPDMENNYDGMIFMFEKMFGPVTKIICMEQPMLSIKDAEPLAQMYLETVKQAGKEYASAGQITKETQEILDRPMLDPEQYRKMCSGL